MGPRISGKTLATQSMAHGPEELASPGALLDMKNLRLHPGPLESESAFNKIFK